MTDPRPDLPPGEPLTIVADPEIADLIPRYLEGRRADVDRLREALAQGDFRAIEVCGHKLAGSGTSFGFEGLTAIGAALETAAVDDDRSRIAAGIDSLESYLARVQVVYET